MNELPRSGPGRPHHSSYSLPLPGWSLLELVVFIAVVAIALEVLSYV